jgi:hypothetical protein
MLINKIICYVKDEGTNLFTMTYVLKQIVNCEELGILAPFKLFVLAMPFFKLTNMHLWWEVNFRSTTNGQQISIIVNSSLYNIAKKIMKTKDKIDISLFGYRSMTMKVKHTSENKVCLQSDNIPIGLWI